MDSADILGRAISALGATALTAITAVYALRRPSAPTVTTAAAATGMSEAAIQTAINDGFSKLSVAYEARDAAWSMQVDELRGDIRNLVQHIESLEALLRRKRIPVPKRKPLAAVRPLQVLTGGKP